MSRYLPFTTLAFALLAGCGHSLSPGGTTSSSSSAGGTGGAPPAGHDCSTIAFRSGIIHFHGGDTEDDDNPRLVATGSPGRLALAFERRPAGSTSPLTEVRHTVIEPFGDWPLGVPPMVATPSIPATPSVGLVTNGIPLRAFALTGTPDGSLGLLTVGDADEAAFHPGLDPFDTTGNVVTVPGTTPMFATHDGDAFLVAAQNDYDFLDVSLVSLAGGAPTVQSWPLPCSFLADGFDPYPADAVPFGDGFLVATSNVFSSGDPGCPATSPTVLHRVRAGESPVLLGGVAGYPVAVATHPEGLWMAWSEQPSNAPPHLDILRIDGETGAVVVAKTFTDVGAGSVALASMDRAVALAWTTDVMSQQAAPPEVHLRVLSESGDTVGEAVLHDLDAPWRISAVASPDARSVVVAWGQWASAGRISVARADCIGGS